MWTAIIAAILAKLLPILVEAILAWLEELLKRAAASMPDEPVAFSSVIDQRRALYGRAIELHDGDGGQLWWWSRLPWSRHARKRRLLERLRDRSDFDFSWADREELRELSESAAA